MAPEPLFEITTSDKFNMEGYLNVLQTLIYQDVEKLTSKGSNFHAVKIPRISLSQYLDRVLKYCPLSRAALIVSMVYLCRLSTKCGEQFINPHTVHRQLMTSIVVASKFCDDFFETNSFYARVGGISLEEMNSLELEFLARMNFDLVISDTEFVSYENFIGASLKATFESKLEYPKAISSAFFSENNLDAFSWVPAS